MSTLGPQWALSCAWPMKNRYFQSCNLTSTRPPKLRINVIQQLLQYPTEQLLDSPFIVNSRMLTPSSPLLSKRAKMTWSPCVEMMLMTWWIYCTLYEMVQLSTNFQLKWDPRQKSKQLPRGDNLRTLCWERLLEIAIASQMLPSDFDLKDITNTSLHPIGGGGFGDVYTGTWGVQKVAIKVTRIHGNREKVHRVSIDECEAPLRNLKWL